MSESKSQTEARNPDDDRVRQLEVGSYCDKTLAAHIAAQSEKYLSVKTLLRQICPKEGIHPTWNFPTVAETMGMALALQFSQLVDAHEANDSEKWDDEQKSAMLTLGIVQLIGMATQVAGVIIYNKKGRDDQGKCITGLMKQVAESLAIVGGQNADILAGEFTPEELKEKIAEQERARCAAGKPMAPGILPLEKTTAEPEPVTS